MSGYKLSAQAAAAEAQRVAWRGPETKSTWTLDGGRPGESDRDNFTTNRVTVAAYDDARAGGAGAIGLSATYACTTLIAGTIASLSPSVYQTVDGVRVEARDHPLFWLLRIDPNYDQSAYEFWEYINACIELRGNGYSPIQRRSDGTIIALAEPIRPELMTVRRGRAGLQYEWKADGERRTAAQGDMLHIRGFGGSVLGGASTLAVCGAAFSGAVSAESAARAMFRNGLRPSGAVSYKSKLDPVQRGSVEDSLETRFSGVANSGRPLVLDNDATWTPLTVSPEDAQMLESRKFSGEEICRIFGVPPAMVGYGDKASNWGTGKEVDVLGFIKFALRKRLRRIEQSLMKQLLTRAERQAGMVIEFNLEGLLRGDSAGRAAFYQIMVRLGVMTRNEARRLENLPAIEGGDVPMVQMQEVPLEAAIAGQGAA